MAVVTYMSPLHHVDTLQTHVRPLPSKEVTASLEHSFINDAVRTTVFNCSRRLPIIPDYNAVTDPQAQRYIQTPRVRKVLQVTVHGREKPKTVNKNKLSSRRRCIPTPDEGLLESREEGYINDAIRTERRRTKYRDTVLVPYNVQNDPMCRDYFTRKDIQVLLVKTTPASSMTSSLTSVLLPRIYTSDTDLYRNSTQNKTKTPGRGESPEHKTNRSQTSRINTSPYSSNRNQNPGKSRQTSRDTPRDNMPVSRSQNNNQSNKSPRVENKNTGSNNHNNNSNNSNNANKTPRVESKNKGNNDSSLSNSYGVTKSLTSPRIPEEPLAEPVLSNKLSHRRRCVPTPPPEIIREREDGFVLDSVTTEKRRTKYRDIIPKYDAVEDVHAKAYFKRDDVQRLVNVTCTLKPWEKDIKEELKNE